MFQLLNAPRTASARILKAARFKHNTPRTTVLEYNSPMIPGQKDNHPTFAKSFGFAWQGLRYAFKTERNIKAMLVLFCAAVALGLLLRCDASEWGIILIGSAVVFCAELVNTALETIVDLVSPEYHTLAGHAKDISAAAVYVLSLLVGIAGIIIFVSAALRLIALV